MRDFLVGAIKDYLESLGLPSGAALNYAVKGFNHFERQVSNSKDPFKDSCDYAGGLAAKEVKGFKYKSPKASRRARTKRPQEAFNFN